MAITVVTFCACYVPTVLFAVSGYRNDEGDMNGVWFGFLAAFCPFIGSAINPFIYALRASRFRSALRQVIRDPCGANDFQDKEGKRNPVVRQDDDTKARNYIRQMVKGRHRVGNEKQLEIVPKRGSDQLKQLAVSLEDSFQSQRDATTPSCTTKPEIKTFTKHDLENLES